MPLPATYNMRATRGDTYRKTFTWTAADGTPRNLTGASAKLQAKDGAGTALFTLATSPGSGITLGGTAGTIEVVATAAQTTVAPADYPYDLQLTLANGDVRTLLKGVFAVSGEVTT